MRTCARAQRGSTADAQPGEVRVAAYCAVSLYRRAL